MKFFRNSTFDQTSLAIFSFCSWLSMNSPWWMNDYNLKSMLISFVDFPDFWYNECVCEFRNLVCKSSEHFSQKSKLTIAHRQYIHEIFLQVLNVELREFILDFELMFHVLRRPDFRRKYYITTRLYHGWTVSIDHVILYAACGSDK